MSMSSLFIATLPNQNYEKQDSELQNSTGFGTDGTKKTGLSEEKQDYLEENRTLMCGTVLNLALIAKPIQSRKQ